MEPSEDIRLHWDTFELTIRSAFKDLRHDQDFPNVTLVCGSEQLKAHKVILSSCSALFDRILREIDHPNPLLSLSGVGSLHMSLILDWCYGGEVQLPYSEIHSFLKTASDLQVRKQ